MHLGNSDLELKFRYESGEFYKFRRVERPQKDEVDHIGKLYSETDDYKWDCFMTFQTMEDNENIPRRKIIEESKKFINIYHNEPEEELLNIIETKGL